MSLLEIKAEALMMEDSDGKNHTRRERLSNGLWR